MEKEMLTPLEETKRLADVAEKLMRETMNLRRDVRALVSRIEPIRGIDADPRMWSFEKPIVTAKQAFAAIDSARRNIRDAERELAAARANIDSIAGDVISRDELKPWIIEPPARKPRGQG
jgi:hypothetical protein